jgi:hypothetical protein
MYPNPESVRAPRQHRGLADPAFQQTNPSLDRLSELVGE